MTKYNHRKRNIKVGDNDIMTIGLSGKVRTNVYVELPKGMLGISQDSQGKTQITLYNLKKTIINFSEKKSIKVTNY